MLDDHFYATIMAGGGGTRLWPLSRQNRPKQMLKLSDDSSLFQMAVQRLEGVFPPERILVITTEEQARDLQIQAPQVPVENYLLEPMPKGTASVVGLAAVALQHRDPQAVMAVLTADHYIRNVARFHQLLQAACQAARQGHLVTLGIAPTYPATGYGYIQSGQKFGVFSGLEIHQALRFKEKPDEYQARQMLTSGDHTWNSGMFVWQIERILAEFTRQMPELYTCLQAISHAWDTPEKTQVLRETWPQLKPESIDYGIMEHAADVAVIPAIDLGWNDVGSWESLFEIFNPDESGNVTVGGDYIAMETHNSLVFNTQDRLVVTIGVTDLVVVDTGDVLLVCRKDQSQKVRQVVERLKQTRPSYT